MPPIRGCANNGWQWFDPLPNIFSFMVLLAIGKNMLVINFSINLSTGFINHFLELFPQVSDKFYKFLPMKYQKRKIIPISNQIPHHQIC